LAGHSYAHVLMLIVLSVLDTQLRRYPIFDDAQPLEILFLHHTRSYQKFQLRASIESMNRAGTHVSEVDGSCWMTGASWQFSV